MTFKQDCQELMVCMICKDEFKPKITGGWTMRTCSSKCSKERKRRYNVFYYLKNKKRLRKVNNEYCKVYLRTKYQTDPEFRKLTNIRSRTKQMFSHLKNSCQECGGTERLQFHHYPPLAFDRFKILCLSCHNKEHGKVTYAV